jgi:hypothetical protein
LCPVAPASRFGFCAALLKAKGGRLEDAFGARLDDSLRPLKGVLTAPLEVSEDGATCTAVLGGAERSFDLAVALAEAAWPVRLRCTLVAAPPAGAAGRDDAVRAKAQKLLRGMDRGAALRAELPGRSAEECTLADAVARLHRSLTSDWTEGRWQAVRAYRRLGRQADVARELGVTQQAVSQMLLGARLRELVAAEAALRAWLAEPRRTTLWPLKLRGGPEAAPARNA